jgi:hypothetical protein
VYAVNAFLPTGQERSPQCQYASAPTNVPSMKSDHHSTSGKRALLPFVVTALVLSSCRGSDKALASDSARADSLLAASRSPVSELPKARVSLTPMAGARAVAIGVRRDSTVFGTGSAVATFANGDSVVVSDSALRAWTLGDGRFVAVSGLDGAGGFSNEGQSLTVIDLETGTRKRVVSDYFVILDVKLLESAGRRALLVQMRDGAIGSLHVTIVDAARGQVFRETNALARIDGARIVVREFGDGTVPVSMRETRTPVRVDTIPVTAIDTMSLLVIPRGGQ